MNGLYKITRPLIRPGFRLKSTHESALQKKAQAWNRKIGFMIYGSAAVTAVFIYRSYVKRSELRKLISEYIPSTENFKKDFSMVVFEDCVVTEKMVMSGLMNELKEFPIRKEDIIVASFPKSGTTWLQEIVYELYHPLTIDTFQTELTDVMENKFPYLEYPYPGLKEIHNSLSPRLIKTHLPAHLLPSGVFDSGAKVIYIYRNPKDVMVSYYHFLKSLTFTAFKGTFHEFFSLFIQNKVPYSPYFPHVEGYANKAKKESSQCLMIRYEDLHEDPEKVILKIIDFLNLPPLSDESMEKIITNTSFESMKKNPSTNYSHWVVFGLKSKNGTDFMRQGKVGDHVNHFNDKDKEAFMKWMRENKRIEDVEYKFQ